MYELKLYINYLFLSELSVELIITKVIYLSMWYTCAFSSMQPKMRYVLTKDTAKKDNIIYSVHVDTFCMV